MIGRPTGFTLELADEICDMLSDGKSLVAICELPEMPSRRTVMKWLALADDGDPLYKPFLHSYLRAREAQADVIFDECLDIADNATDDVIFLTAEDDDGESGRPVIKHSAIARAKLQIDTRMRMAGKLKPKKYGDKLDITSKTTVEHATKEQRDAAVKAATES